MAKKKGQGLRKALRGLEIDGGYRQLIHEAIVEDWNVQEFLHALVRTKTFRRKYAGLIQNGDIAPFLSGGSKGISVQSLGGAIKQYNDLKNTYSQIGRNFGYTVDRKRMRSLVTGQISPDELGRRLTVRETLQQNPGLMDSYNAVLKFRGMKPLDKIGMQKMLAGAAPREFYDVYESAYLKTKLGLTTQDAAGLGQGLGGIGEPVNLEDIANKALEAWSAIGPEAQREGISKSDLALLANNQDPRGIGSKLSQIIEQRGQMRAQPGTYARQGTGGGFALYEGEGDAAAD